MSVLPVAMIAQWDSSLSVLPVARVMIAQWDSSLSVLPEAWVQVPTTEEYSKAFCGQRGGRPKSKRRTDDMGRTDGWIK